MFSSIFTSILLLSVLPITFAITNEEQRIQDIVDACAVENNYPANKYNDFIYWELNFNLDHCVAACAMRKLGTLSEDGVYTGNEALKAIEKYPVSSPELEETVVKCAKEFGTGGKDYCKTVKNLYICLAESLMKMSSTWTLYGSINQILLFTSETFS